MNRRVAGDAVALAVGVVLLGLAVGVVPVDLAYVYSDSMEPTLQVGDGVVLLPPGTLQTGDVITFYAPAREEYVTHRIVEVTPDGYVTKGDANPSTDQAGGEPLVVDSRVVGRPVTVVGRLLVIPGLETYATSVDGLRVPLGLVAIVFVVETVLSRRRTGHSAEATSAPTPLLRERLIDEETIERGAFLVAFILCVGLVSTMAVTDETTYVVSEAGYDHGVLVPLGAEATRDISLRSVPAPFLSQVVETDGMRLESRDGETLAIIPALDRPGPHRTSISVAHYPAVLPRRLLELLHAVHPLLGATTSVGVVFGPLYAAAVLSKRRGKKPDDEFEWTTPGDIKP